MKPSPSFPPSTVHRPPSWFAPLLALLLIAFALSSAQPLTPVAPTPAFTAKVDSLKADSAAAKKPVARADTARVVMHSFDHRQQLITGGAIMATMISIMVVMNNYNPRVPQ